MESSFLTRNINRIVKNFEQNQKNGIIHGPKVIQEDSFSFQKEKKLKEQVSQKSELEDRFYQQIIQKRLEKPVRQFKFNDSRYLYDFAYPTRKILIEVDGGIYMFRSGHNSPKGYLRDRKKEMFALRKGYVLLRFCTPQILDLSAIEDLKFVLVNCDFTNVFR